MSVALNAPKQLHVFSSALSVPVYESAICLPQSRAFLHLKTLPAGGLSKNSFHPFLLWLKHAAPYSIIQAQENPECDPPMITIFLLVGFLRRVSTNDS